MSVALLFRSLVNRLNNHTVDMPTIVRGSQPLDVQMQLQVWIHGRPAESSFTREVIVHQPVLGMLDVQLNAAHATRNKHGRQPMQQSNLAAVCLRSDDIAGVGGFKDVSEHRLLGTDVSFNVHSVVLLRISK